MMRRMLRCYVINNIIRKTTHIEFCVVNLVHIIKDKLRNNKTYRVITTKQKTQTKKPKWKQLFSTTKKNKP